jgi:hypothetical protein
MKNLFVSFLLSFVSFVSFCQTFVIEGFEHQELISFRNTTVDSVLMNPDLVNDVNFTKYTLVVDLNNQICRGYVLDELVFDLKMLVIEDNTEILSVKLIDGDSDSGIVINKNKKNQNVSLYWNGSNMTSVTRLNKFNISKS